MRSERFCNLLTPQASAETRSIIKYWWNLVAATRLTTDDPKPLSGISFHKRGSLCFSKSKREELVVSELARGCVSKLLLEIAIDLGLNLL